MISDDSKPREVTSGGGDFETPIERAARLQLQMQIDQRTLESRVAKLEETVIHVCVSVALLALGLYIIARELWGVSTSAGPSSS